MELPLQLAAEVQRNVLSALVEDIGGGDLTALLTPAARRSQGTVISREDAVLAGSAWFDACFRRLDPLTVIRWCVGDGETVAAGQILCEIEASTRALLTAERAALNFLQLLSATATATRLYVNAIAGTGAAIRDTRKTTPGMRRLEKYAVRCGGGVNHRMSLSDAALVKDNHVVAAGGVAAAFDAVRREFPGIDVEVEVDSLAQLEEVLEAGADLVLLDNFTVDDMREAVRITAGRARLEASGGLSLPVAAEVASTGVDYLAVGALTHSAPVLDIGADLRQES